ncbi:MAG: hypothetical protein PW792_13490 [Acidobacteriaceae bacterium]|nr:hypothetical protein [Acidobacteriaceae bacterium]
MPTSAPTSPYRDHPTAAELQRALREAPVLARDETASAHFLGLPVVWRTRFFDAIECGRGPIKQLSFTQRGLHSHARSDNPIYCFLDLTQDDGFRELRRGRRVDLYGRIASIDVTLGTTLELDRYVVLQETLLDRWVEKMDSRG